MFILLLNLLILTMPLAVMADGLWADQVGMGAGDGEVGEAFGQDADPTDVRVVAGQVIKIFLGFLGFIFFILVLWAGFKWMTSLGNTEKVSEAKRQLSAAIIGLTICLMSYGIASYITRCFYEVSTGGAAAFCVF